MHVKPPGAGSPKLELPPDLLAEVQRRGVARPDDMRIEGWKPSLFGRLVELLASRRSR